MIAKAARVIAVSMVVAAAIDPAFTVNTRSRGRISVVEPDGSQVAERLRRRYLVERGFDSDADVVVVVGRAYPARVVRPEARVATVTQPEPPLCVTDVDAPSMVPADTAIRVEATLIAAAGRRPETIVAARINGTTVGEARHTWSGRAERWRAAVDVVPVGEPPWTIEMAVDGAPASAGCSPRVAVDRAPPLRIVFYEPRPSWPTTFVRRALERDPRFAVAAVTRLTSFETDPAAIVVGGLDRINQLDVGALDRFVHDRGGALIVLPDESVAAGSPAARLVAAKADDRELQLEQPSPLISGEALPRLTATEMLTFSGLSEEAAILAATDPGARAVVWAARRGAGRTLVSGALDAWRFRAVSEAAFDRFWRAAISGAALGTPRFVNVRVTPPVAGLHEPVRVRVRVHASLAADPDVAVSAALGPGAPVRLWPDAEPGSFSGTFAAPSSAGISQVVVAATTARTRAEGSARFVVSNAGGSAADGTSQAVPLKLLSASHDGVDVTPQDLAPLDRWLRDAVAEPVSRTLVHPMRSPWWILPFAACLSIDWWLTSSRRRRR